MTQDKERAEFEAWVEENLSDGIGRHSEYTDMYSHRGTQVAWAAWQARAALQSQDREDVAVLKVALEEAAQTMRAVLAQERLRAVAKRCLSQAIGVCDRAIDHARWAEGERK